LVVYFSSKADYNNKFTVTIIISEFAYLGLKSDEFPSLEEDQLKEEDP
jgi:hypothetical protein